MEGQVEGLGNVLLLIGVKLRRTGRVVRSTAVTGVVSL